MLILQSWVAMFMQTALLGDELGTAGTGTVSDLKAMCQMKPNLEKWVLYDNG